MATRRAFAGSSHAREIIRLCMADIREIDSGTMADIVDLDAQGRHILRVSKNMLPSDVVDTITQYVDSLRTDGRSLPQDDVIALGVLLGWQYVSGLGWHWGEVVYDADEDNPVIGVLSSDNALFINPIGWMNHALSPDPDATPDVTFMLNYNMVAAGSTPPAQPNEALGFH